jgi:hypothetical protein
MAIEKTTKFCRKCNSVLPITSFGKCSQSKDGKTRQCKACLKKKQDSWYARNPEYKQNHVKKYNQTERAKLLRRNRRLRYDFGMTAEDYDRMYADHEGKCAICGGTNPKHRWHDRKRMLIDHSHKPGGKVRGLLCGPCNLGIGNLQDDPIILERAIIYLRKYVELDDYSI